MARLMCSCMIKTERLHLIRFKIEHAVALEQGRPELGAVLRVEIPDGWPQFPEAYSVKSVTTTDASDAEQDSRIGGTYLFLLNDRSWLVGSGGYKGEPVSGVAEIGYEIARNFQNKGLATEATRAMIDHAFGSSDVDAVIAHTLAEYNASTRVLEKVGMTLVEPVNDPEQGTVWRWRVARTSGEPP